ncbi:MAG: 50S ribosomal protein L27 [Patescibacteria group bacterium]
MAHTKAAGSTKLGRDSQPKYLGVKVFDGQTIKPGEVIVRQRGTKILPGKGVKKGTDDTLYALKEGVVKFLKRNMKSFTGARKKKVTVQIV